MFTTVRSRTMAIFGLLVVLFGLAVWYGALGPAPALGAYPDAEHLGQNYDHYLDGQVSVSGRVIATDPVRISTTYGAGETLQLTVMGLRDTPTEGESLSIYGIVAPDHTIWATNAYTVPQSGRWYAWGISFLAGIWVLTRICRHWRLDTANWTLKPRETPLTLNLYGRLQTGISDRQDN